MHTKYTRKRLWAYAGLLLLLLLSLTTQAQVNIVDPVNGETICPGVTYVYGAKTTASSAGCSYDWTIGKNGTITSRTDQSTVSVIWKDVPKKDPETWLQVATTTCTTSASNTTSPKFSPFVRSISQTSIGPITIILNNTIINSVPFGDVVSVRLRVPQANVPMPDGQPPLSALAYDWTIPRNWRHEDGTVSDGVTSRRYNRNGAFEITVTTSAGDGGTVSVQAIETTCAPNITRTGLATLEVNRQLPTVRIVSNGAPSAIACGDQTNYGFRAEATGTQPGGTYTYKWSASNWTVTNPTSQAPGIIPNGSAGTLIILDVVYFRNGASTPLIVPAFPIALAKLASLTTSPSLAPIGTSDSLPTLCGARQYTASSPGATDYEWETSGGITVNGGTKATGATVTLVPGSGIGQGTVSIRANACSDSKSDFSTYSVTYGVPPRQDQFRLRGNYFDYSSLPPGSSFLVYPNEDVSITATETNSLGQYNNGASTWSWVEQPLTSSYRVSTTSPGYYMFRAPNQGGVTWQVAVTLRNNCGNSETSYIWFTTLNSSTGEEPFRTAPDTAPKAYPNPADAELTVELPDNVKGHVRLYNSQGRQVRQAPARGKQVVLDVQSLPNGLYQLHVPVATGISQQQIQIKH